MDAILRNEMPEYIVFKSALFYCSLIIILPVVAFFSSKWIIFDAIFSLTVVTSNICSAICSVIILHMTLGLFIYRACVPVEDKSIKLQ